jgi:hypothetical protein
MWHDAWNCGGGSGLGDRQKHGPGGGGGRSGDVA